MDSQYTRHVEAMCARNPSLRNLHNFLSRPDTSSQEPRIISIDFSSDQPIPILRDVSSSCLIDELRKEPRGEEVHSMAKFSQILLIEDIDKKTIDELGYRLSVNPMFFAAHLHSGWRGFEAPPPKFCELPSRARKQHFATFYYHRSLVFPAIEKSDYKLVRQSNVPRKVIVFPPIQGQRLGLAQHCCSVLVVPRKDVGWLGMCNLY